MNFVVHSLSAGEARAFRSSLIALLIDSVNAGASIGFIAPLSEAEAGDYWDAIIADLEHTRRVLIVATDGEQLVGTVQLNPEMRKNGRHRAEVQKLMVHTAYRRKGIAKNLMTHVLTLAQEIGLSLLVLDVREGDPAERLYRQVGFIHSGTIPYYAQNSHGGFDPSAFYYRILEPSL